METMVRRTGVVTLATVPWLIPAAGMAFGKEILAARLGAFQQ